MVEIEKSASMSGAMICINIDAKLAGQLELIGGEPPERMHITLAYLGDAIALPFNAHEQISEVLEEVTQRHLKLKATISGLGRFEGPEGEDAVVALVDAAGLEFLRNDIVTGLLEKGLPVSQLHGFTPHITLAYVGFHEQLPRLRAGGLSFKIKSVAVVMGDSTKASFKLRGTRKAAITAPDLATGGELNDAHGDGSCLLCGPEEEECSCPKEVSKADVYDVAWTVGVSKADEEKRLVYGVVLEPESVDMQEDIIDAEGIEFTAHGFLAGFNRDSELGIQHSLLGDIGVELVESYIAPVDFKLGSDSVRKGSWVMVVHVSDDEIWKKVKRKELTGFSVAGTALIAES